LQTFIVARWETSNAKPIISLMQKPKRGNLSYTLPSTNK